MGGGARFKKGEKLGWGPIFSIGVLPKWGPGLFPTKGGIFPNKSVKPQGGGKTPFVVSPVFWGKSWLRKDWAPLCVGQGSLCVEGKFISGRN